MKARLKIIEKLDLAIIVYRGVIDFESLISHIERFGTIETFRNCKRRLIDVRNCKMAFTPDLLHKVSEVSSLYSNQKTHDAFLINSPKETAYTILYAKHSISKGIHTKVFTTLTKALIYVDVHLHYLDFIQKELKQMEAKMNITSDPIDLI